MIRRIVNSANTRLGRSLLALVALLLLPLMIVVAIIAGVAFYIGDAFVSIGTDLYYLLRFDVPRTLRDLTATIRKGSKI
jgi:Ni,Fe-hydrogenase I cytochrome b subunit